MTGAVVPLEVFSSTPSERQGISRQPSSDRRLEATRTSDAASASSLVSSQGNPGVVQFPYVVLIRQLIQQERITAARRLLSLVLSSPSPAPELFHLQRILAPALASKSPHRDRDRASDFEWLISHGIEYRGEWVAVIGGQLLAHSSSLAVLLMNLSGVADEKPLIHWIDAL